MDNVRVYRMPACRMVSSGRGMFGEGVLENFSAWFGAQPRTMFPEDYLWFDGKGFVWYYVYRDGMEVPEQYEIVDFPGGMYAVATGKDNDENAYKAVMAAMEAFIANSGCFERDPERTELGNIISAPDVSKALGYEQMDYYIPIRVKRPG